MPSPLGTILVSARGASSAWDRAPWATDALEEPEEAVIEAAQGNDLGVKQVDQVADPEAEPAADLGDHGQGGFVAGGGPFAQRVEAVEAGGAGRRPGVPQERRLPGLGLPASGSHQHRRPAGLIKVWPASPA